MASDVVETAAEAADLDAPPLLILERVGEPILLAAWSLRTSCAFQTAFHTGLITSVSEGVTRTKNPPLQAGL
jgi:hypothetical protein